MGRARPRALRLLFLAGLALAGCGVDVEGDADEPVAGTEAPAHGDTFIQSSISDIAGLIPNITSDATSHDVGGLIYDGLVRTDRNLNWVGQLAESWTFSRDCMTLTFKLRQNVRWHDGHRFTADDVLFTYRTMIHPKTPTAYKDDFLAVKDAEVLDPYTVRVSYPRPHARALQSWAMNMLPRHLLEPYVAEGKLSCQLYQRSADIFLGVPFNIASYALLTLMMAQASGLKPGDFVHTFGDAHLYSNHLEQVDLQLSRTPFALPVMKLNPQVTSLFDFRYEDFELTGYQSHPGIKAPVAV